MGRGQDVIAIADVVLNAITASIEEIHYWRGRALATLVILPAQPRPSSSRRWGLHLTYAPAQEAAATLGL